MGDKATKPDDSVIKYMGKEYMEMTDVSKEAMM